ncbi:aldehyde dehydrogenase family protein, partial [Calidithermus chliarophilus]
MIETGRLPIVNPPRSGPSASLNPEFFARLARRVPTQSGVFEAVRSPFDQQVLAELPICTPADVAAAVQRAREAQAAWAKVDPRERARVLLRF